jgi:3-hydroxyisobutyrate dehydrogenase-like beta-hydroxyacid dehydrogenase
MPDPADQAPTTPTAFIGVGQMGAAMAGHLVDAPGGLIVCDPSDEAVAPLIERGARRAATPAEAAEGAAVISVMVLDDAQVRDVVSGPDGALRGAAPGSVIAVHSTIRAGTAIELAELARTQGVHLIDAPVSGGFMGAHAGTLATMVGGSEEAVALARPHLAAWAQLIVHLGPVGAGTRAKIARNLMHFVSFTAASEAQRLAEASGIDLRKLAKVVRHTDAITGGAGSIMLRDTTAPMSPDDDWWATLTHVRRLGEKDLDLALELGDELDVDLPLGRVARERFGPGLGFDDDAAQGGA